MKKVTSFIIILSCFIVGISWSFHFPLLSRTWTIKQRIQQNRKELDRLWLMSQQTSEMKMRLTSHQETISHLSSYLPQKKDLEGLSERICAQADDWNVTILEAHLDHSIVLDRALGEKLNYWLKVVPFRLHLEGQFSDICYYLEWIEDLPYFLGFDTCEMWRVGEGLVRANMAFNIVSLSHQRMPAQADFLQFAHYSPVPPPAPEVITAQKNLRIRTWGRDIFSPALDNSEDEDGSEYLVKDKVETEVEAEEEVLIDEPTRQKRVEDREEKSWLSKAGAESLMKVTLNGIVNYQGGYIALINDQRVKKGDVVQGMEVAWITENRVCLARGGEKVILNLK